MDDKGQAPPEPDPPPVNTPSSTVTPRETQSYADRAKMNLRFDQRLKRNVLEIEIEKMKMNDEMILSQEAVAKLLGTIGMDINTHVEGYQVSYRGKSGKIAVLCKEGLDLDRFCRQESFEVCKGVQTKNIRPAGRQDVTVTVSGLDYNTPDTVVQDYITKFGGILVSKNVIYGRHGEGPFKGKVNGDRKYQVDFSKTATDMGTYHFLDGERLRVYYRGNRKTCGRCHKVANLCPGGGIAKECQEMGGQRVGLIEHMKILWDKIGFSPTTFKIPEKEIDTEEINGENLNGDQKILDMVNFPRKIVPPTLREEEKDKISGVRITNFPLEVTEDDVLKFLRAKVDKTITPDNLVITKDHRSSIVLLSPGQDKSVIFKAKEILDFNETHKIVYPDRKLYAKLQRTLTPVKSANSTTEKTQIPVGVKKDLEKTDTKVKTTIDILESKKEKNDHSRNTSQAKLSSASIMQIAKHKQGLGIEKQSKK